MATIAVLAILDPMASAQTPQLPPSGAVPEVRTLAPQSLAFEEHRGPADADVEFVARGLRHTLTLQRDAAVLAPNGAASPALRMTLPGATGAPRPIGSDPRPGRVYHVTSSSRGTLAGSPTFGRVTYGGVYPGVDLVYYGNERQLEFDFVVAPRRDPTQIRLAFSGAERMTLESNGELSLRIGDADVRLKKPSLYQERDGRRAAVSGGYRIVDAGSRTVAFQIGEYDHSRQLVIDPTIVFATYRGGADAEFPRRIQADGLGNTYLFANTLDSASLPVNQLVQRLPLEIPQPQFGSCFLTKISRDGTTELYTVIFEGAGCQAMDVAPDGVSADRKIHVQVGSSFHYQRTLTEHAAGGVTIDLLQGAYDACQLGSCGPVQWMRADSLGNVYFIMSHTPAGMTPPEFIYELRKIDGQGRLAASLQLLRPPIYSSPTGNFVYDQVTGLDLDAFDNLHVIGIVASPNLITPTANAFQRQKPSGSSCPDPASGNCFDGFLLRVNDDANGALQIDYASYLGGNSDDRPFGIAHDPESGDVYITGNSISPDFPTTAGSFVPPQSFSTNGAFVVRMTLNEAPLQQMRFGTFLSHSYANPAAIAVLPGGLAAIIGAAGDDPCRCFPLVQPLHPPRLVSETRPFLSVLAGDGRTLPFSTFLDSSAGSDSFAADVATNGTATVYVALTTNDATLGTPAALQPTKNGGYDAMLQAIDVTGLVPANDPPTIVFTPPAIDVTVLSPGIGAIVPVVCGRLFTCSLDDPDSDLITHLEWSGPNGFHASATGLPAPANQPGIVPSGFATIGVGTHAFTLVARDERGGIGTATLTVNVHGQNTVPGPPQTITLADPRFVADNYRPLGSEHPITVTFTNVSAAGLTWMTSRSDLTPPPPAGLQAGSPPYYYDLFSTAAFSGTVRMCVDTRGMSLARSSDQALIYQLGAGGDWTPISAQDQPDADHLCGDASSLGTFAIFYPQVVETAITTIAGTGCAEDSIDGAGGDPCDDFTPVAPATQSSLTRPGNLAASVLGQSQIYVADNGSALNSGIRRFDSATGLISTVVPGGICYGFGPIAFDRLNDSLLCTQWDTSTGLRNIVAYDLSTHLTTTIVAGWSGDITALVVDNDGSVYFADGLIYRVPAGSGAPQLLLSVNSAPAPHHLPYYDRFILLALDAQGHLLAGGQTLIRLSPGADGHVDGSPDETVARVAGIPGADLVGYAEPFGGDGLPATQAMLGFTYQMIVASDGAVVFTDQSSRIRRVDPGADGIVDGDTDEIVRTIAGYFSSTLANPGDFATSEYGDFRGLVEDPGTPGAFIVSSHGGHKLQRFGIAGEETSSNEADLSIAATGSPNAVVAGGTLHYTVRITNNGPLDATGVGMSMPITADFAWLQASSPAGFCVGPLFGFPGNLFCDAGSIPRGGHVDIGVDVRALASSEVTAHFSVSGHEADSVTFNNTTSLTTEVRPSADLAIRVASPALAARVAVGVPMTIDVSVSNFGPAPALTARVRFEAPANLQVVGGSIPGGVCETLPGLVVCDVDNFGVNANVHALFTAVPTTLGPVSATFNVSAPLDDPTLDNNSTALIATSDLIAEEVIRVTDGMTDGLLVPEVVHVRDQIASSELPLSGDGTGIFAAEVVHVVDHVSSFGQGGGFDGAVSVAANEIVHVVDGLETHPPDLFLSKAVLDSFGLPSSSVNTFNGARVRFHLRVVNGANAFNLAPIDAFVTDTLDSRLIFDAQGSDPRCSAQGQLVSCAVGNLPGGSSTTFSVDTLVRNDAAPVGGSISIANVATVSAANAPSRTSTATVYVQGPDRPDLSLIEQIIDTAGTPTTTLSVPSGAPVRLRLTVGNRDDGHTGPSGAITVSDTLQPGLVFLAAGSDPRCSATGQLVTCTGPFGVYPGQSEVFDLIVRADVPARAIGSFPLVFHNQSSVSTADEANLSDNVSAVVTLIIDASRPPDLQATKTILPPFAVSQGQVVVFAGDQITYRIGASNRPDPMNVGPTTSPIVVTDTLAPSLGFVSADPRCTTAAQTVTCAESGTLVAGQSVSFDVVTAVRPATNPPTAVLDISNTASASTGNELATADNTSSPITVRFQAAGAPTRPGDNVLVQPTDLQGNPPQTFVVFYHVSEPGTTTAIPMASPPPIPAGFQLQGVFFEISTTAVYDHNAPPPVLPILICFDGTFASTDSLYHFENGVLVDITISRSAVQICGATATLSPFGVLRAVSENHAPAANAGIYAPVEATSAAGASVHLVGTGSDPDPGDVLTFAWREGGTTLGVGATLTVPLSLGNHDLTFIVSDNHGGSATAVAHIVVRDTTPPVVTAPANIAVPATEKDGARGRGWQALASFLNGTVAVDLVDHAPVVTAFVNGAAANADTLFPIGKTTVTFKAKDAAGNVGTTTADVMVSLGDPHIDVRLARSGTISGTRKFVELVFTNTGNGIARSVTTLVIPVAVKGAGVVKLEPADPLVRIGDLNPGASTTVRMTLIVPATVKEVALIEAGSFFNVKGRPGLFADSQSFKP